MDMDEMIRKAARHLASSDPVLMRVIKDAPPCSIRPHKDYYRQLVQSIIGQQLSIKSAAAILKRFKALYPEGFPTPQQIVATDLEDLRAVGLSRPKAAYIKDLAEHVDDGRLNLEAFDTMGNEEIIIELSKVKGIGEWTAHMFLMFAMARLDILAVGDLGIRLGIQKLYKLDHLPFADEIHQIAAHNHWNPYETVACWYIWHAKDNA